MVLSTIKITVYLLQYASAKNIFSPRCTLLRVLARPHNTQKVLYAKKIHKAALPTTNHCVQYNME